MFKKIVGCLLLMMATTNIAGATVHVSPLEKPAKLPLRSSASMIF